jgi:hypothetical protein
MKNGKELSVDGKTRILSTQPRRRYRDLTFPRRKRLVTVRYPVNILYESRNLVLDNAPASSSLPPKPISTARLQLRRAATGRRIVFSRSRDYQPQSTGYVGIVLCAKDKYATSVQSQCMACCGQKRYTAIVCARRPEIKRHRSADPQKRPFALERVVDAAAITR